MKHVLYQQFKGIVLTNSSKSIFFKIQSKRLLLTQYLNVKVYYIGSARGEYTFNDYLVNMASWKATALLAYIHDALVWLILIWGCLM